VKPLHGFGGRVLTEDDVDEVIEQFVTAAKIAHDAGADGIDFKNCHGYLGSQLVRPYNDRTWKYGGSFENRTRFTFEVYERIQKEINAPSFIVGSKVSFWEGFPGGQGSAGPTSAVLDLTERQEQPSGRARGGSGREGAKRGLVYRLRNRIELLIRQNNVGCTVCEKEYTERLKAQRQQEGQLAATRTYARRCTQLSGGGISIEQLKGNTRSRIHDWRRGAVIQRPLSAHHAARLQSLRR
jgi:hypothetical protein